MVLFIIVTIGALVSGLTGLGGGTLVLAGLLSIYPPSIALPLHSFNQLTANSLRAGLSFKTVDWKIVFCYGVLMLPAAWLGALVFDHINSSLLKIFVGFFILISVLPFKWKPIGEIKQSTFVILGAVSGFLGVFIGAVGPMITPFFNRLKLQREAMIATKAAGQTLLQVSKILAFHGAARIDFMSLKDNIGILVGGTLLGVILSLPLGRKISDKTFDKGVNILLGLLAIKVLIEGITELIA